MEGWEASERNERVSATRHRRGGGGRACELLSVQCVELDWGEEVRARGRKDEARLPALRVSLGC